MDVEEPIRVRTPLEQERSNGRATPGQAAPASITHRPIPALPERPRAAAAIGPRIQRSYPVGAQAFSRAYLQRPFEVSVTTDVDVPAHLQLALDTTMNAPAEGEVITVPFQRVDGRTFRCTITPTRTGLFRFLAKASDDGGATWVRDAVQIAWVLVDPPQIDALRLYTLIPTASGTIADWTADLPRIKSMGFDAVHLLPITRLDTSGSPYSAYDLFDVDHSYLMDGDKGDALAQLDAFVERAGELGLRLCFDLVLNHVGVQSIMARRAPSWIVPDERSPDGNKRARYWADNGWRTWDDLVLINYEHPSDRTRAEIWQYMTEYALFWGRYADHTGGLVRFDNLHGSDPQFVKAVSFALHHEYPTLGILAEYFTDDQSLLNNVPRYGLSLVLATPWNYKFVPELRNYLRYVHRISEHLRYLMPITSHDSGSPAQEFGAAESTVPRYVAAALLGTGATGITQGVEWGIPQRIDFIGHRGRVAPDGPPRFAALILAVNDILAGNEALRRGGNCEFVDHDHPAVIAAFRPEPGAPGHGFLIACNFDIQSPQALSCDLSALLDTGSAVEGRELLGGTDGRFPTAAAIRLTLPPCGAMVWRLHRAS